MLKVLILCVTVLCLAQAYNFQRRGDGAEKQSGEAGGQGQQECQKGRPVGYPSQRGVQQGQEQDKPFGPKDLVKGITYGRQHLKCLSEQLDDLAINVNKKDKTDKEWFDVLTDMADMMKNGHDVFMTFAFGSGYALHRMFAGDHGFEQNTRCTNLGEATNNPSFGQKEFLPKIEDAMKLDMQCFKELLKEMVVNEIKIEKAHDLTETDVVEFLAITIEDLFILRNDGVRFCQAVWKTTNEYKVHEQGIHDFHETEFNREKLVRELLTALQARK